VNKSLKLTLVTLALAIACFAQDSMVTVTSKGKQKWPAQEVDKIYLSACSAVQREFGGTAVRPPVTLVLGADKDGVDLTKRTIQLIKWDRDLFAQGVVLLAFQDLLSPQRRVNMAKRAVNLLDETVDIGEVAK